MTIVDGGRELLINHIKDDGHEKFYGFWRGVPPNAAFPRASVSADPSLKFSTPGKIEKRNMVKKVEVVDNFDTNAILHRIKLSKPLRKLNRPFKTF